MQYLSSPFRAGPLPSTPPSVATKEKKKFCLVASMPNGLQVPGTLYPVNPLPISLACLCAMILRAASLLPPLYCRRARCLQNESRSRPTNYLCSLIFFFPWALYLRLRLLHIMGPTQSFYYVSRKMHRDNLIVLGVLYTSDGSSHSLLF